MDPTTRLQAAQAIHLRTVQRAAEMLGGSVALKRHLGVPMTHVSLWLQGMAPVPPDIFLRCVDIVLPPVLPLDEALARENRPLRMVGGAR
jgi:hypothetical protein